MQPAQQAPESPPSYLREGTDFYWENGKMVMTRDYHIKRGYCCRCACRHCPYGSVPPTYHNNPIDAATD